jgi:DNA ligase (NAD+)
MDAVLDMGIFTIAAPESTKGKLLDGLSFCFTGELTSMKRTEAAERVKALGGTAKTSVIKGLSYLVTNNPQSGSTKNQKARELGVSVINEAEFLKLINGENDEYLPEVPGELF